MIHIDNSTLIITTIKNSSILYLKSAITLTYSQCSITNLLWVLYTRSTVIFTATFEHLNKQPTFKFKVRSTCYCQIVSFVYGRDWKYIQIQLYERKNSLIVSSHVFLLKTTNSYIATLLTLNFKRSAWLV